MPRPPVDEYWRRRVYTLAENNPGWRRGRLARALREEYKSRGGESSALPPPPSDRSIGRLLQTHRGLPHPERARFRYAFWPEAMRDGLLPWEAGMVLLDLTRRLRETGKGPPTLRLASWVWHVHQAAPDCPMMPTLLSVASLFSFMEEFGDVLPGSLAQEIHDFYCLYLAYHPWSSPKDNEMWANAAKTETVANPLALMKKMLGAQVAGTGRAAAQLSSLRTILVDEVIPVLLASVAGIGDWDQALDRIWEDAPEWRPIIERAREILRQITTLEQELKGGSHGQAQQR